MTSALESFARDIGDQGPVGVEGGRTRWDAGGEPDATTRFVRSPAGVMAFEPAEMTVRVGAGTSLRALHDTLAEHRQTTVLEGHPRSTVGGTLAVGQSGLRRLRTGPVRDALLEARYVSAEGRLVVAGGPTVKNVTGYDLCRLLVGSLGTLGFLGEVVLRTRPIPQTAQWMSGAVAPDAILQTLHRPSCVLWDGTSTWALLEGYGVDVEHERDVARSLGMTDAADAPDLPPLRSSIAPAAVLSLGTAGAPNLGRFVAEVGVGIVHAEHALPAPVLERRAVELHRRVKHEFDPRGRCNPGRDPLRHSTQVAA